MKKIFRIFIAFIFVLSGPACKKQDDIVPNVYVDVFVYLNQPANVSLNSIGNWKYIDGGVKGTAGIVLYRRSMDEFVAFDRVCTYQPKNLCAVEVESSNVQLKDACCGSKFLLYDGSPSNGPASRALKQYNVSFLNGVVHVYN